MYVEGEKKVLFVTGMEHKLEDIVSNVNHINPEDIIILNSYERGVLQPFGDIMREIIIAVYQDNIEEIIVVANNNKQTLGGDILSKLCKNKDFQGKLQTLDYLFNNCQPEFPGISTSEWLEGDKTATNYLQKTINTVRNHPLLPADVKVQGILINSGTEELIEITR